MATPLSPKLPWPQANPIWAQSLNPILANPLNQVQILENISLINGNNIINHKLGRSQQGWFLTDLQAPAIIYRSAPFNSSTLTLISNVTVIVNIGVF